MIERIVYQRNRMRKRFLNYKIDLLIVQISLIFNLFTAALLRYIQYLYLSDMSIVSTSHNIFSKEAYISFYFVHKSLYLFYFAGLIYIIVIVFKYCEQYLIYLKQNSFFLILILNCDIILYSFNFKAILKNSYAFRFVIICLLTNLVVYIKYKKNNIKIK